MIKTFKLKGLEQYYLTGNTAGIPPSHATELKIILTALNAASQPSDMKAPVWRLHPMNGNFQDHWAVIINGSWRLIFKFNEDEVEIIDYQNYKLENKYA
ncbi:Plasmid maintenance system killer protein [Snodgrassella alvi SCGC AB-598-O02]|jgi:Plasmid maintenance system killer protein|nr:type II toxin-antitoxin system RelE/ParE family toxin [Snodgrassella alvi]KES11091.1 Plasmid maintenance system killer protein [Snodgrassella alvi SCGC AB-598-O02]